MLTRVLLIVSLASLSTAAWAQDFGLDVGCCSSPLTGAPVSVNGNGGGVSGYFNSIDTVLTELTFVLDAGLGKNNGSFTCISFNFFKNCTTSYDPGSGLVTFEFSGVNEADGDEGPDGLDNEANLEFEGLPDVPRGCLGNPDTEACLSIGPNKGHFLISFNTFGAGNTFKGNPNGTGTWAPGTIAALAAVNGTPVVTFGVDISIKPNATPPVPITANIPGTIPVAVLSTPRFNAVTSVDASSLTFGRTGTERSLAFCNTGGEDVNGDGLPDLVCHFRTRSAGFQPGDTLGILMGKTILRLPIIGQEAIQIVP